MRERDAEDVIPLLLLPRAFITGIKHVALEFVSYVCEVAAWAVFECPVFDAAAVIDIVKSGAHG